MYDRFATENSVFFVPEATLGLGLAGGLSYALPRLLGGNQPLALCLALTGMALEGPDLFFTQIATSYMTHRRLEMMTERLAEVGNRVRPGGYIGGNNNGRYSLQKLFWSWCETYLPLRAQAMFKHHCDSR